MGEVVRVVGLLIYEAVVKVGTKEDFVGFVKNDTFLLITFMDNVTLLLAQIYEAAKHVIYEYAVTPYPTLKSIRLHISMYLVIGIMNADYSLEKMRINENGVFPPSSIHLSINEIPNSWQALADLFEGNLGF